jgi:hypothetical protein
METESIRYILFIPFIPVRMVLNPLGVVDIQGKMVTDLFVESVTEAGSRLVQL